MNKEQLYVEGSPGLRVYMEAAMWGGSWTVAILLAPFTLGISLIWFPVRAHLKIKKWRTAAQ